MFYESISKYYDYIFPQNTNQLEIINNIKEITKNEKILDIGCATGNLSLLLNLKTSQVIGIDLDRELLNQAEKKSKIVNFQELNMLDISKQYEPESFSRVVSFGNTLVHLNTREEVKEYFNCVYTILKPGGVFVTQIINYDRIINRNVSALDTIKNENIEFVRDYRIHKDQTKVDFNTTLKLPNGCTINNSITLLALRQNEISEFLKETGFKSIKFYGDLKGNKVTNNSVPLIFSCIKE